MKAAHANASSAASRALTEKLAATRFTVHVPQDRRVTFAVPLDIDPGEAEVIILHRRAQRPRASKAPARGTHHPAFGLWADRPEAADPVAFVDELRSRIMERRKKR
ncbi:MAG: hypothetical protein ACHQ4J_14675 [Candidatus Binatia bacterium]